MTSMFSMTIFDSWFDTLEGNNQYAIMTNVHYTSVSRSSVACRGKSSIVCGAVVVVITDLYLWPI